MGVDGARDGAAYSGEGPPSRRDADSIGGGQTRREHGPQLLARRGRLGEPGTEENQPQEKNGRRAHARRDSGGRLGERCGWVGSVME